jgi:hypothetical protein
MILNRILYREEEEEERERERERERKRNNKIIGPVNSI